ncbi:MAG TPA: amidohydrolase family protein [Bryobacteraceae bacterium]|nr:amidohydrolase family protein [Bryobacteraceae bacterium]
MTHRRDHQILRQRQKPAYRCAARTALRAIVSFALFAGLARAQALVIKDVTVIDATGAAPKPNRTVIVVGDRITAVEPANAARIPANARVVDGAGKFLIPGLWDMHVHGAADGRSAWTYPLFLANGVVGVREMFGPPDGRAWRVQHATSGKLSPLVLLGSPIVDGPNPQWPTSIIAADEAQGRAVVVEQQQRGADFIKVYSRLPRDAYFAIADEARNRGIAFAGHVPYSVTAAEASAARQRSIEHLGGIVAGCSREEKSLLPELRNLQAVLRDPAVPMSEKMSAGPRELMLEARLRATYDDATAQSLFATFVKNNTWQCPTLTVLRAQLDNPQRLNDPRAKYLGKEVRASWERGFYGGFPAQVRPALIESAKADFEEYTRIVGGMYRAGVKLLAGSDALNPECFPGFGIHDELALLVDAGLPPLAALQIATRNAAEFMGQLDRRGTIEAGKAADLILLTKDPLAEIRNTRSIEAVVLGGKWIPRSALDAMLAEVEGAVNGRTEPHD